MLDCAHYTVLVANSAIATLRIANDNEVAIDCSSTDVIMPDMQGPDLAQEMSLFGQN